MSQLQRQHDTKMTQEQAGAELGKAQVKLDIVVIVVEVVVKAMVEVEI